MKAPTYAGARGYACRPGNSRICSQGGCRRRRSLLPALSIVAFGSCFAANIGHYLASAGFNVRPSRRIAYVQWISDGLVNVHAILQQFEWAWEERVPKVELCTAGRPKSSDTTEVRSATKALFDEARSSSDVRVVGNLVRRAHRGSVLEGGAGEASSIPRHKFRLAT